MCMRQLHASRSRGLATVFFTVSASAARTEIPCLEAWCCSRCQLSRQCNMINNGKPKNRLAIVLRRLHWRLVHRWLSLHFLSFFFPLPREEHGTQALQHRGVTAARTTAADDCSGLLHCVLVRPVYDTADSARDGGPWRLPWCLLLPGTETATHDKHAVRRKKKGELVFVTFSSPPSFFCFFFFLQHFL